MSEHHQSYKNRAPGTSREYFSAINVLCRHLHGILLLMVLFVGSSGSVYGDSTGCDLRLYNGKILTMNATGTLASSVGIAGGRFLFVDNPSRRQKKCRQKIDLKGHTVVPGLIDSHIHFLRDARKPGHDVRTVESAFTLAELYAVLAKAAAETPADSFLVAIGGFNHRQFAEKRMPTADELDAAVPGHPVYIQGGGSAMGAANSMAMTFFSHHGIRFPDDGVISSRLFAAVARALASRQNVAQGLRETRRLMLAANRTGLTTIVDQGGTPSQYNPESHYDAIVALWRKGQLTTRMRLSLLSYDTEQPGLLEERLRNNFMGFGDEMLKISGVGEQIIRYRGMFTDAPADGGALLKSKLLHIAEKGWTYTQHSSSLEQNRAHIQVMSEVAQSFPLQDLHWTLAHVFKIGEQELAALKQLGVGVTVQDQSYLSGAGPASGPPFRRILDAGVRAGAGTDARGGGPLSPWLSIYYMITGMNSGGKLINEGQTISRMEALRLYTRGNAWVLKEPDLGSIAVGNKADLAVLNTDFTTVTDQQVRRIESILTVVGGNIVYQQPGMLQ